METMHRLVGFAQQHHNFGKLEICEWQAWLCRNREDFSDTAINVPQDGGERWWYFLEASQGTFSVSFMALERVESLSAELLRPLPFHVQHAMYHLIHFKVNGEIAFDSQVGNPDPDLIQVVPHVTLSDRQQAWSDCHAIPWKDYVAALPERTSSAAFSRTRANPDDDGIPDINVKKVCPWLKNYIQSKGKTDSKEPNLVRHRDDAPEPLDPDDLAKVFAEYERLAREVIEKPMKDILDFCVVERKGKSAVKVRQVVRLHRWQVQGWHAYGFLQSLSRSAVDNVFPHIVGHVQGKEASR